ncbi:acyl-CoA N-acyltransferase [Apiospora arundinis]
MAPSSRIHPIFQFPVSKALHCDHDSQDTRRRPRGGLPRHGPVPLRVLRRSAATFFPRLLPTHGTGEAARGAAIEEAAARLKLWNAHDKTMYWQKVVDSQTGRVAGGALWNIHKENPFANPSASEVTWFPDDGSRRRQGVGQQFMNWGMKKADELGFDFYLDSTPYGRPLYEANGFR